jgi:hypothetical protein
MSTVNSLAPPPAQLAGPRWSWKVVILLLCVSVLGSALLIPYSLTLVKSVTKVPEGVPADLFWVIVMGVNLVFEVFLSAMAIFLGLYLGRSLGLGAPLLQRWLENEPLAARQLRSSLWPAVIWGVAMGVLVMLLDRALKPLVPPQPQSLVIPGPWAGFLASIGAGIREEIWLRLGVLTFAVWLGAKLTRQGPSAALLWMANIIATLLFGAIHLPQAAQFYGKLTVGFAMYVLLLNGTAGLAFGWLYWRRGLVAAMMAHFSADVVLKVMAPLVRLALGR